MRDTNRHFYSSAFHQAGFYKARFYGNPAVVAGGGGAGGILVGRVTPGGKKWKHPSHREAEEKWQEEKRREFEILRAKALGLTEGAVIEGKPLPLDSLIWLIAEMDDDYT